jgi:hypothetical protein
LGEASRLPSQWIVLLSALIAYLAQAEVLVLHLHVLYHLVPQYGWIEVLGLPFCPEARLRANSFLFEEIGGGFELISNARI